MFFKMRLLLDPPANPKEADITTARKDAESWLSDFRNYQGTPEGCGVRYYFADILFRQAADAKDKGTRTQYLNKARDLCFELTPSITITTSAPQTEHQHHRRRRGLQQGHCQAHQL